MNILIVGYGEIGKAVHKVFGEFYKMDWVDLGKRSYLNSQYDILHVCIPWSDRFVEEVNSYISAFKPVMTFVHSTIPIGTTRKLHGTKFHAPVRGRHEHLHIGIQEYEMYLSGEEKLEEACSYVNRVGIRTRLFTRYEITEAAKLLSLLQYGMNIEFARYAGEVCEEYGLSYSQVVKEYTRSYNQTISKLENSDFIKTILNPPEGRIGGHCVLPAIKILNQQAENDMLLAILEENGE